MARAEKAKRRGSLELPTVWRGKKRLSGSWAEDKWHALHAQPFPPERRIFETDLAALIRDWVVPGHRPPKPLLSADDRVVTLGSCFARELRTRLEEAGFASSNVWIPSGLNNTFAILDFISWCVTGEETGRGFRYDRTDNGAIAEWAPLGERDEYVARLRDASAFVFTLGLAEVWEDAATGGVFWRGVPNELFDAERHVFRLSSVEENEANILRIVELIRTVNARAPVVLTLSPVPLKATFRDISCIVADCASKSTLRTAIERALSRRPEGVYYWPSFEIVRWAGAHLPYSTYDGHPTAARDVSRRVVAEIIDAFVEAFYTPDAVATLRAREAPSGKGGRSWLAKRR